MNVVLILTMMYIGGENSTSMASMQFETQRACVLAANKWKQSVRREAPYSGAVLLSTVCTPIKL